MFNFVRPDAIKVLDDNKARSSLERYFEILEGKRAPKATFCKSIEIDVSLNESDEILWREHDRAIEALRELEHKAPGKASRGKASLLDLKIELASRIFRKCSFCERKCEMNRTEKAGFCGVVTPRISSMFHHYGEEPELVPSYTIFFSGCNFHCQFCQNHDISQKTTGYEITPNELAGKLNLVRARNINWVGGSPTPNLNFILESLNHYRGNMPSVWNSNMYMSEVSMKLLEGTQDVFLTDLKYGNDECAERLSKVKGYSDIVKRNHILAKDQGELIIRHLVLPNHVDCCTSEVARFVAEELGKNTRFNLMFQYRPMFKSHKHSDINRSLNEQEKSEAVEVVLKADLENIIK
jgi:putative pyruvate formate lyase activating enzyme